MKSQTSPERSDRAHAADGAIGQLREQFLHDFDPAYVDNVILPYFRTSVYTGERPSLPMIFGSK